MAERCGVSLETLQVLANECERKVGERILATLLVVALYRSRNEVMEAWEPMLLKAEAWLTKMTAGPPPGTHATWSEWATSLLPPDVARA